jgi:hypothetical protein
MVAPTESAADAMRRIERTMRAPDVAAGPLSTMGAAPQPMPVSQPFDAAAYFAEGGPVMPSADPMEGFSIEPEARPAMQPQSRVGTGIGGALSRMGQSLADSSIVRGAGEIPGTVANYFSDVTAGPDPSQRLGQDLGKLGSMVYQGVKADPVGAVLDVLPVVGEIRSGMDANKYSRMADEAEAAGDEPKASTFRQLAAMATAGAAPLVGTGARLAKSGAKAGVEGIEAGLREGAEAAAREGTEAAAREGVQAVTEHPSMIDTRYPTGKARIDEVEGERLLADFASMKATPKLYEDNVNLVKGYVNMPESLGSGLPDEVAENFINHAKDNLLYLHDQVPDNIRQRSQLWYDGARKISEDWANEYGISDSAAAGALAALSPQKDWYQNVSLAKRVVDALKGNGENFYNGFAFSPEMQTTYESIASLNKPAYTPLFDQIKGRSLGDINKLDLPDDEKAILKSMWIRLYDEGHNSKAYPIVTPEGGFGDAVKTGKGADARVAWGSMNEISKAIRAIESNGDPKLLNEIMGGKHKVRNFYNNILAPNSTRGDVTIDTHAVAASLMRPLSQKSVEVAHNFKTSTPGGLPGASGSAASGIQGTYPLYAEAYRRAAEERGILPRQMQSITWEAVRGLFPDTFKTPKNMEAVDALWSKYRAGEASLDETREAVSKFAGGVNPPTWYRPSGAADEALQGAGDAPVVSGSGVPRKASGGAISGGRGRHPQELAPGKVGFAEGGALEAPQAGVNINQATQEVLSEIRQKADEGDLDQRKIAYLIRMSATGTFKPESAYNFAGEILEGDLEAIRDRFAKFPRTLRILSRLDRVLGGEAGRQYGVAANERQDRPPVPLDGSAEGFAKGGKVKARKLARMGSKGAMEEFEAVAERMYGAEVAKNIIGRSGDSPAKVMFAMNQYAKNLMLSNPPRYSAGYKAQLRELNDIAKKYKIETRRAFNQVNDIEGTKKDLNETLKSKPARDNAAFSDAIKRLLYILR